MSGSYEIKIKDWTVKTRVVCNELELSVGLTELLSSIGSDRNTKRVVGLDIERSFDSNTPPSTDIKFSDKVVLLKLSTAHCCLLIRLHKFCIPPPTALVNFLALPDVSFAGVGIRFCLDHLNRDFGLKCRNTVELGQVAAAVKKNNQLGSSGLADLAEAMCFLTISVKDPSVVLSSWRGVNLSPEQIESATSDAFVSFLLGNQLLGGFDPPKDSNHSTPFYYGYDY